MPAPDPGEIAGVEPINTVFCHADRWIVQCPDCGQDYQFVWLDDRLFMCSRCWNSGVGGKHRRYAMPGGWEKVNVAMGRAPDPVRRNWVPVGVTLKGAIASQPRQTMLEVITEMRTYG